MTHLVLTLSTLALLVGFFMVSKVERTRGMRFFEAKRARLDGLVTRIQFIVEHVDLLAFLRDEIHHAITRIGHETVQLSLQAVRAAERLLTRAVRHLRTKHDEEVAPRETAREFVKTLSEFKDGLNAVHPELHAQEGSAQN